MHGKKEKNGIDTETFYDFNKESYKMLVLGSYKIMRNPSSLFFLNVAAVVCLFTMYVYGVAAGFYTMVFLAKSKALMVQAFYGMGLMCVSFGLHTGRIITNESLKTTTEMITSGIYVYNEEFQDGYIHIKKKRIKQLKLLASFISNGMFFCAFNNSVIVPLMQVFVGVEEEEGDILNPYLPFQIYIPFNTRNLIGYSVAYALNTIVMFTMYASFACHEELYMSTTLQLTTELEVLRYSLINIEKRAMLRLKASNMLMNSGDSIAALYNHPEYQKSLYLCLRENILHHHQILRFKEAMNPYDEATTTVVILFFSFLMAAAIVIMLENTRPQLTLITDIFGFLPMCWVGQLLANESARTKHALFATPWPDCSENFKMLLKIFMTNVQKPMMIRARGFNINICLETFADMVSIGYKIINVMR